MLGFKAKLIFITRCSCYNSVKKHKLKHFGYSIRHHNGSVIINIAQVSPLFLTNEIIIDCKNFPGKCVCLINHVNKIPKCAKSLGEPYIYISFSINHIWPSSLVVLR